MTYNKIMKRNAYGFSPSVGYLPGLIKLTMVVEENMENYVGY